MLNKLFLSEDYLVNLQNDIKSVIILDASEKDLKYWKKKNITLYSISVSNYSIDIKGFSRIVMNIRDFIKRDNYKIAIIGKNSLFLAVCVIWYDKTLENDSSYSLTDCIRQVSNFVYASVWKNIISYNQMQFIKVLFEPVLINSQNDITIYGIRPISNRNREELEQKRKTLLLKNFVNIFLVNRKKLKSSFE